MKRFVIVICSPWTSDLLYYVNVQAFCLRRYLKSVLGMVLAVVGAGVEALRLFGTSDKVYSVYTQGLTRYIPHGLDARERPNHRTRTSHEH